MEDLIHERPNTYINYMKITKDHPPVPRDILYISDLDKRIIEFLHFNQRPFVI